MKLLTEETGQGMAEYALVLVFVAMAAITALGIMGGSIRDFYQLLTDKM